MFLASSIPWLSLDFTLCYRFHLGQISCDCCDWTVIQFVFGIVQEMLS